MPTVFINDLVLSLPHRWPEGSPMLDFHANILWEVQLRRIKAKVRYLLERGELLPDEAQAKALELAAQPLAPYATLDDEDNDPILAEALAIAKDLIITRMAKEGLPPPKAIDAHAKALVDAMPALAERARLRIEARYRAATAALACGD